MRTWVPAFVTAAAVAFGSAGSSGQAPSLSVTPLRVASSFTITASGGVPGFPLRVACDTSPGPIEIAGIGTLRVGLTNGLVLSPILQFDAQGQRSFPWVITSDPGATGAVLYFQAAAASPSTPSGHALSNGHTGPIHPETPDPGPQSALTLGDDEGVEVPLPPGATFPFYGTHHTCLTVNSNGNISFGGPFIYPSEYPWYFLYGLPKIAMLWDDLSPPAGGSITVQSCAGSLTVAFTDIQQFWIPGPNTFRVTLYFDGRIAMSWSSLTAPDGLVGISPGSGISVPGPVDFAAGRFGDGAPFESLFERFWVPENPNDLAGQMITFVPTGPASYRWIR